MAKVMPIWTAIAVVGGVVALGSFIFLRKTAARRAIPLLLAAWSSLWVVLALFSILNTLE